MAKKNEPRWLVRLYAAYDKYMPSVTDATLVKQVNCGLLTPREAAQLQKRKNKAS